MFTEKDLEAKLDIRLICIEANRLICDDLKIQTLHNQSSKALKDKNLELYLQKVISKALYNFHKTTKRGA